MNQLTESCALRKQTDLVCIAFLETDIDLAFTFLRLAAAEIRGGKAAHASQLMEKAILAHKTVIKEVDNLSVELAEEKCELHEHTQRLWEAIVSSLHDLESLPR